ncbi:hypothetical protein, partial [Neorhizobium galegae]|uniref:hypothetical protein n=1 Tax=Neorhizobium galegae TaxID=399 RepID=UPI00210775F5
DHFGLCYSDGEAAPPALFPNGQKGVVGSEWVLPCKLAFEAVQIIELRQFGDKSASAYGFGEEDGYEYTKDEDGESPFSGDEGEAPAGEEEVEF